MRFDCPRKGLDSIYQSKRGKFVTACPYPCKKNQGNPSSPLRAIVLVRILQFDCLTMHTKNGSTNS